MGLLKMGLAIISSSIPKITKTDPFKIKLTVFQTVWLTVSTRASRRVMCLKRLAFRIPDTTTAMIPETWSSSAKKKVNNGRLNSNNNSLAISLARTLKSKVCSQRFTKAVKIPTANPPMMEIPKEIPASPREKLPVARAAKATRKATRPEASFSNPSPFKIFETRFGKVKRSDREAKATKSVGPRAAPTAIQAAKGRLSHKE